MAQEKPISLKYVVDFPDGLSSRVGVYGLDSRKREVYGGTAFIGVSIEVGDKVEPHAAVKGASTVRVQSYAQVKATAIKGEEFRVPLAEMQPNWEDLINNAAREQNANSIRVESPEHVQVAIERHRQAYEKQFKELAGELEDKFNGFMEEHPLCDFPDCRPKVEKHRLVVFSPDGYQGSMWLRI